MSFKEPIEGNRVLPSYLDGSELYRFAHGREALIHREGDVNLINHPSGSLDFHGREVPGEENAS
jgi:hypothetical protein